LNTPSQELHQLFGELRAFVAGASVPEVNKPLAALEEAAELIGKAWSGSWFGYHSRVYYEGFASPPPGAHFSSEWGLIGTFHGTTGNWQEFDFDVVKATIARRAGDPDLTKAREIAAQARAFFDESKDQLLSILETVPDRTRS
jgi:hypothetical protein